MHLAGDEFRQFTKQEVTRLGAGIVLFTHLLADTRVGELGPLLLNRSGGRFTPGFTIVKQIPVGEGDTVGCPRRRGLSEDLGAFFIGFLQPAQLSTIDVREFVVNGNCVKQDRTATFFRQAGVEIKVVVHASLGIVDADTRPGKLDAAFATPFTQSLGHGDIEIVGQHVGDHRRAVKVALHRG